MAYWGRNIDKFGTRNVLTICGILTAIVPINWLFSSKVLYLVAIQIFSGFAWAGFELAAFNLVFDNVKPGKRARCVSYQNVLNGSALFVGANAGGLLLTSRSLPTIFDSQIKSLFLISGICRLLVAALFLWRIQEPRVIHTERRYALFWQLVAIQPVQGLIYQATHGMKTSIKGLKNGIGMLEKFKNKKIFKGRKNFKP